MNIRLVYLSILLSFCVIPFFYGQQNNEDWKLYPSTRGSAINEAIQAQLPVDTKRVTSQSGSLVIYENPKITKLLAKYKHYCDTISTVDGYRIQIFSQSGVNSRNEALVTEASFSQRYPKQETYVIPQSPYFKVRVGDFKSKLEALKFHNELKRFYPHSYLVEDKVTY